MAAAAAAVLLVGAVGLTHPHLVPAVPAPGQTGALTAMSVGLPFLAIVEVRAARTVLLARRPRDLCALLGLGLLTAALVAQYTYAWGQAGFIMGHAMEIVGIVLAGVPVALDACTRTPSRPLVGDLTAADLVAREEAFLGPGVHALMERLAEKDEATEGHTRRVAMLAVEVARRSASRPPSSAGSRSAACCTTSASSASRTRS